jgi:short-subunit dehydrogenase
MSRSNPRPVALVTGASSGIGAVYAERLAARGHDLILVARRTARLQALSTKLSRDFGSKVEAIAADLTRDADIARIEQVLATNPDLSLLVNNAGNGKIGATADMSPDGAVATLALNVTALTRLTRAVLPAFLSRNTGAIINIASVLALHSLPMPRCTAGPRLLC